MKKRFLNILESTCVCCGACQKVCPKNALSMYRGCFAKVDKQQCVGCGLCTKVCPTNSLEVIMEEV